MQTKREERIKLMREGKKLKCPKCKNGHFSAVGDPKTTLVFGCDKCETSMVLTKPIEI